eukprot:165559-Rhodomonas_salina.1
MEFIKKSPRIPPKESLQRDLYQKALEKQKQRSEQIRAESKERLASQVCVCVCCAFLLPLANPPARLLCCLRSRILRIVCPDQRVLALQSFSRACRICCGSRPLGVRTIVSAVPAASSPSDMPTAPLTAPHVRSRGLVFSPLCALLSGCLCPSVSVTLSFSLFCLSVSVRVALSRYLSPSSSSSSRLSGFVPLPRSCAGAAVPVLGGGAAEGAEEARGAGARDRTPQAEDAALRREARGRGRADQARRDGGLAQRAAFSAMQCQRAEPVTRA